MANITHKGNPIRTNGELPAIGSRAPAFTLVDTGLAEKSLRDFAGKKKVLTINPSYDTGICQKAGRAFNEKLAGRGDVVALMISADLPFAIKRFCEADGLQNVAPLSAFRSTFAKDYGVQIVDGLLQGLTARAVVVLDENDEVLYTELVPEIGQEPSYDGALGALG